VSPCGFDRLAGAMFPPGATHRDAWIPYPCKVAAVEFIIDNDVVKSYIDNKVVKKGRFI